ncbi:hypothetical protein DFH09DRAFT_1098676 [Mycena vulgaris]|nr:hypothetical protein DFH09DRAFT_1098676 [Mycena vulgaris]
MASSSTGRNATPGPSAGGGTAGSGGPQAGEKRRAQSPADDPSGAKKSRRGKAKTKAKISEYHVKRDEIPEEYKGTKECIHLHGYILYGICASDIAPPLPTPAHFEAFNQRFEPGFLEALKAKLTKPLAPNEEAAAMVKQLRDQAESELKRGSHIAKAILRIKDNFLTDIFSAVLTAGLIHWCPDLMSPSDKVYNKAHALIFIETFKSVAGSFAYRQLAPIPSGMCDKRVEYALHDKQPDRVISMLSDPRCHSDDESGTDDNGNRVFLISKKSARSVSAAAFTHHLEAKRIRFVRGTKGKKRQNISDISFELPEAAPIDWFDPDTYNDLPAQTRFDIFKKGVALPLVQHHQNPDWKMMDKATFMTKYGNEVLKQYRIPTPAEMEEAGNAGWEEDEVDDMMQD